MSTASDDACKMFDAVLTQYVSYYNDDTIGGVSTCVDRMLRSDPDFIMGHVIRAAISGKRIQSDAKLFEEINTIAKLSKQVKLTPWEQQHVEAITLKCMGHSQMACSVWEDILVEYPLDMLSLKLLYDTRAHEGNSIARRDYCARVLPYWQTHMPLYGDLLSMYAFGLEETNFYTEAEKLAHEACEMNPHCVWANHCIAHCTEMTSRTLEGKIFMEKTEKQWNDCTIACHCYWHWALFYFEDGEFEAASSILREHMIPRLKTEKGMPAVMDVSSLCFRLEAEGFDMKQHWQDCYEVAKCHMDDRIWTFWDIHAMLSCVGAKNTEGGKQMIHGIKEYIRDGEGDIRDIYQDVAEPAMEAFEAYGEGEFEIAVDVMKPLKYKLHRIGASVAQRDIFNLFLIHAGLRSRKPKYRKFAQQLLNERKGNRNDSPLVRRLFQKSEEDIGKG